MRRLALPFKYSMFAMVLLACRTGHAGGVTYTPFSAAEAESLKIATSGKVLLGRRVSDALGEHVLLLTEKATASANGRIERRELVATYFDRSAGGWRAAWQVKDGVDCPELDSAASFFPNATTITDLDSDGAAEVTVAYKTFCGGGVDPSVVKVILRQGKQKYAIRGESLIKFKGQEALGGTNKPDKALLAKDKAVFKQHMEKIWRQVYVERSE